MYSSVSIDSLMGRSAACKSDGLTKKPDGAAAIPEHSFCRKKRILRNSDAAVVAAENILFVGDAEENARIGINLAKNIVGEIG